MIRTILASAATIALTASAAVAQGVPSATGLTPGAPLASDPYSGESVVVGETSPGVDAGVPIERPAAAIDEPLVGAPVVAEPTAETGVVVSQAPAAPVAVAPTDQFIPSPIGLTPGAPLGSDPYSDQKIVAGEEFRAGTGGIFIR
jgi:hypothetical protein